VYANSLVVIMVDPVFYEHDDVDDIMSIRIDLKTGETDILDSILLDCLSGDCDCECECESLYQNDSDALIGFINYLYSDLIANDNFFDTE
jgi:hypothetical protein